MAGKVGVVRQEQEFEEEFRHLYPRIYSYIATRTGDPDVAQDLTAEVFARAWESWGQLTHREARVSWLFAIARNMVASHFRHAHRQAQMEGRLRLLVEAPSQEPEEAVLALEEREGLREALAALSEREQEILRLRFEAELDSKQVGQILGLNDVHVRVITCRALAKLRRAMAKQAVQAA